MSSLYNFFLIAIALHVFFSSSTFSSSSKRKHKAPTPVAVVKVASWWKMSLHVHRCLMMSLSHSKTQPCWRQLEEVLNHKCSIPNHALVTWHEIILFTLLFKLFLPTLCLIVKATAAARSQTPQCRGVWCH